MGKDDPSDEYGWTGFSQTWRYIDQHGWPKRRPTPEERIADALEALRGPTVQEPEPAARGPGSRLSPPTRRELEKRVKRRLKDPGAEGNSQSAIAKDVAVARSTVKRVEDEMRKLGA